MMVKSSYCQITKQIAHSTKEGAHVDGMVHDDVHECNIKNHPLMTMCSIQGISNQNGHGS